MLSGIGKQNPSEDCYTAEFTIYSLSYIGWGQSPSTLTLHHSLALCLKRVKFVSSAHSAPMNEPMLVPPIISIGIPASFRARMIPTCAQPLKTSRKYFHQHLTDYSQIVFSVSNVIHK